MNVDVTRWDARNAWPMSSGELAMRPGFRRVYNASAVTPRQIVASYSVKNSRTDAVWHYIVDVPTTAPQTARILVVDENFVTIQAFATQSTGIPRGVSWSVVQDQLTIGSPDFATIWGLVGGGLVTATKKASVNPNTTALPVPRGICVSWAGRNVIIAPDGVYFSDALEVRTYVGQNAINPPGGAIYGGHVSAGGALVLCTASGVYALPEQAAASGQIVIGIFSKITDYECIDYNTTAISHGRVYGLTRKGYRTIDNETTAELLLDEKVANRQSCATGRIVFPDYRDGRLYGGSFGPIAAEGTVMHMNDLATGTLSWMINMNTDAPCRLRGLLYANDGEEMYAMESGVYRMMGNYDTNGGQLVASLAGVVPMKPSMSPVLRFVTASSDGGAAIGVSVGGSAVKSAVPPQVSPISGTDTWDAAGLVYREAPQRSRRLAFATRTDNLDVEVSFSGGPCRIGTTIDLDFKGPGRDRPSN